MIVVVVREKRFVWDVYNRAVMAGTKKNSVSLWEFRVKSFSSVWYVFSLSFSTMVF